MGFDTLLIFFLFVNVELLQTIFVEEGGDKTVSCGTNDLPCDFHYALENRISESEVKIILLGGDYSIGLWSQVKISNLDEITFEGRDAIISTVGSFPAPAVLNFDSTSVNFVGVKFKNLVRTLISATEATTSMAFENCEISNSVSSVLQSKESGKFSLKNLTIRNSLFVNANRPIFFYNDQAMDLVIENSNFTENRIGGFTLLQRKSITAVVRNCFFGNNSNTNNDPYAGGFTLRQDKSEIEHITISLDIIDCEFDQNLSGGINVNVIYGDIHFLSNTSKYTLNSAYNFGGGVELDNSQGTIYMYIEDSIFENNFASKRGGGIALDCYSIVFHMKNSKFRYNNAFDGAGVSLVGVEVDGFVQGVSFFSQTGFLGGGLHIDAIYAVIHFSDGNEFENNYSLYGAGMMFTVQDLNITMKNTRFDKNFAKSNGGAIFLRISGVGNTTIKNSHFEKNTANSEGGAVFIYLIHFTHFSASDNSIGLFVHDSVFNGNKAINGSSINVVYQPLANEESQEEMISSFFGQNQNFYDSLSIENVEKVEENSTDPQNSIVISGCDFQTNSGVAVKVNLTSVSFTLSKNVFIQNEKVINFFGGDINQDCLLNGNFFEENTGVNIIEQTQNVNILNDEYRRNMVDDIDVAGRPFFYISSRDSIFMYKVMVEHNNISNLFDLHSTKKIVLNAMKIENNGERMNINFNPMGLFGPIGSKSEIVVMDCTFNNVSMIMEPIEISPYPIKFIMNNTRFSSDSVLIIKDDDVMVDMRDVSFKRGYGMILERFKSFYAEDLSFEYNRNWENYGGGAMFVQFNDYESTFEYVSGTIDNNKATHGGAFEFYGKNNKSSALIGREVMIYQNYADFGGAFFFNDLEWCTNIKVNARIMHNEAKDGIFYYYFNRNENFKNMKTKEDFERTIFKQQFDSLEVSGNWSIAPYRYTLSKKSVYCYYQQRIIDFKCVISKFNLYNPLNMKVKYLPQKFFTFTLDDEVAVYNEKSRDIEILENFVERENITRKVKKHLKLITNYDQRVINSSDLTFHFQWCNFPNEMSCNDVYLGVTTSILSIVLVFCVGILTVLVFFVCVCYCTSAKFLEEYLKILYVPQIKSFEKKITWNERITTLILKVLFLFNYLNCFMIKKKKKKWKVGHFREPFLYKSSRRYDDDIYEEKINNSLEEKIVNPFISSSISRDPFDEEIKKKNFEDELDSFNKVSINSVE